LSTSTTQPILYVGVDVSKKELEVHILPSGDSFAVSNDQDGLDELTSRLLLEAGEAPPATMMVVLEATGGYERPAMATLAASENPCGSGQSSPGEGLRQGYREAGQN
jgi:transposase